MVTLNPGQVVFYASCTPPLSAGEYRLTVEQSLKVDAETPSFEAVHQSFRIEGPRFYLNPEDIHSVSPPSQGDGPFEMRLPHIVLCRRTLPWERDPNGSAAGQLPWLALLLLTDAEYKEELAYRHANIEANSPVEQSGLLLQLLLTGGAGVRLPDLKRQATVDEELERVGPGVPLRPVKTLEITTKRFQSIAPCQEELDLLCHARQVSLQDKELLGSDQDGWFSVVACNRLPTPGMANHVFLVSLEGHVNNLPKMQSGSEHRMASVATDTIRLAVLHSWQFRCNAAGRDFEGRMKRLRVGMLGATGAETEGGTVTLGYETFEGKRLRALYRGPLVPAPIRPDPRGTYFISDQARRVDPSSARENLTYAAALELGRLMALSNPTFCIELQRWRRDASRYLRGRTDEARQRMLRDRASSTTTEAADQGDEDGLAQFFTNAPRAQQRVGQRGHQLIQKARAAKNPSAPYRWRDPFGPVTLPAFEKRGRGVVLGTKPAPAVTGTSVAAPARQKSLSTASSHQQVKTLVDGYRTSGQQKTVPVGLPKLAESAATWLAQLRLLEGVPFAYLVPEPSLLPPESIRFFYLDINWTNRLVDGALSVGRVGSRALQQHHLSSDAIMEDSKQLEPSIRARRLVARSRNGPKKDGGAQVSQSQRADERCGFILRSIAVRDYPGLEAVAFEDAAGTQRLPLLRLERLAPDVLLCIVQGTPRRVELREPSEGIQLGFDPGRIVKLRHLLPSPSTNASAGMVASSKTQVAVEDSHGNRNVLNIMQLVAGLETALKNAGLKIGADIAATPIPKCENDCMSSAELAIQLLQPPYTQVFAGERDLRNSIQLAAPYVFILPLNISWPDD